MLADRSKRSRRRRMVSRTASWRRWRRSRVPGFLMVGLTVLPMLVYVISVGVTSFFQVFTAICIYPVPTLLDRAAAGDESEPTHP